MPSLARFGLDDKVVIVTGAGRGIGRVIAREAAESGALIAVGSRTTTELETLTRAIEDAGGACFHHALDVTDLASIAAFTAAVVARYGRIDVLVNNAGYNKLGPIIDTDEALYQRIVDANLKSVLFCSQAAARQMIAQGSGGAIVNISSQASVIGAPERGIYSGAKAGVNNMSRTMAAEWAEHGIRVNVVAPTVTRSPLAEQALADSASFAAAVRRNNLLRHDLAEPEEISAPVIFLASDAASMITGQVLVVDGGWTMV
ncbi:MAG: glucose 1-dehydrogenase [Gammaproteobacteria bacterium]|nr:glucose 1-dehydrogenase [Gammaproteobacteria bacterium]MCP5200065.1 glucose 1-dehydrogenase [Gammaproteobacteria bacterium]